MTGDPLLVAAAIGAALAAGLWSPPPPRLPGGSSLRSPGTGRTGWRRVLPVLLTCAAGLTVLSGRALAVAAVALGVAVAGHRLLAARRQRMDAARTAARGLETCEQLAAELSAGQPPGTALDRAAEEWPPLLPVAEAFRIGADVPAAWRQLARRPGAGQLRYVGASWQVAQASGHGLAAALERAAADLRDDEVTRRVVTGELASARATARLVAALPLLALLMGSGAGGDPWAFLLGHPVGLACLAGGLGLGTAGLWWIEAIARGVERR